MDTKLRSSDGSAGNEPAAKALFDLGEPLPERSPAASGSPRLRYANRQQTEMRIGALDSLIPEDHQVRIVWAYVDKLDLSELLANIKALKGTAARRPPIPESS